MKGWVQMEASADQVTKHVTHYSQQGRPSPISPLSVVASEVCKMTKSFGIPQAEKTVLANPARLTTSCDLTTQLCVIVCVCVCVKYYNVPILNISASV